ncbi:MAG: alpha/beta hydrolase [Caldilineaceae bacterium]
MRFRKLSLRGKVTYIVTVMLVSLVVMGIGFVWWASQAAEPMPEALAALQSTDAVAVDYTAWLTFTPTAQAPTRGLIFYPGGRVDARAYAPAAQAIAEAGYLVVITPMPLNLAVLAPNRAAEVIAAFPEIAHWALGGHSLGGAMAANFVAKHPDTIDVLVLWAAYPAAGDTLATRTDLTVVSISGTNDGLATPADIAASHALLPANTTYVAIAGGNHAQFGWYGAQPGDNAASIARSDQQADVIAATVAALQEGMP